MPTTARQTTFKMQSSIVVLLLAILVAGLAGCAGLVSSTGTKSQTQPEQLAPSITSVNPTSGAIGAAVTISGANFGSTQGSSTVVFNGVAGTPTSWSATAIVVPVPTGATTGSVVVTVGGLASNAVAFTVSSAGPNVSGLNPTAGLVGTTVTITGTNFGATQGTSTVKFNGITATATSWSATSIATTVPTGATTGNVVVTVGGVASNGVSFTVTTPAPSISSVNPTSGNIGAAVTITGANFGASQGSGTVKFNGIAATPTSWSGTSIVVAVPAGATSGNVVVTVGGTASNGVQFTVNNPGPSITGLSPNSGVVGAVVTITGANFGSTQGTSTVSFSGTAGTPTSWTATSIVVPVPTGATTGSVVVKLGTVSSNGVTFTVTQPAATISTLNPTSGLVGAAVTITGTNFGATQGTSTVKFNGTVATPTSWSLTSIVAPVPTGATSGNVVVTVGGTASNGVAFTVTVPTPSVTSLNPSSGQAGAAVTITGTNFGATQGSSTVKFNGTGATATSWSTTSISAKVPPTAASGNVVVTVSGTASNGVPFTVLADTTAPSVPTGLTATAASSSQISLSWTASTDNVGVKGYNVLRGGTQVGTSTTPSYSDTGLTASTNYTYTVSAYDAAGNTSSQSASANATTLSTNATCASGLPCTLGWYQIPNTSISGICPSYTDIQAQTGCPAVMSAWSGGLVDTTRNRFIIHGGGHSDYYGNEIYAIDFNATPIAPGLVHDASHGSAISNVGSCPEAFSDGTPNARHTYNGLWYLPTQDAYWMYGAGLSACGNFSDGQWTYSPTASTWKQLSNSNHPNSAQNGSTPQFAYDSVSDSIYEVESNTGIFWQYNPATNAWTDLATISGCGTDNATTAIDPVHRLYMCVGSGDFHKITLGSPYTATDLSGASGCSGLVSALSPGFTFDPVQQKFVGYVSGNGVYVYDPVANSCTTQTYTGGPTTVQPVGTYGRFQYMPGIGGFVYVGSTTTNVWFLRLTAQATAAQADLTNRCNASGVIVCDNLSSSANMPQRTCADSDSGMFPDCFGTSSPATVDASTYRSGGGSALFTIPGTSGTTPAGYYRRLFAQSQSTVPGTNDGNLSTFGSNSDFYVSYAQRMDSGFINDQAPQQGGGATYWKQQIISWSGSTCGQLEITTVNDFNEGFPLTYSQCGDLPFQNTVNGTLYNEFTKPLMLSSTPGPGYNCPYGSAQPDSNCFDYPANLWVTYYYHVHVGTWGSANSLVEGFVSTPSSPAWRQWLYENNLTLNLDPGNTWGFDMVTLIPYWTGRNSSACSTPCSTSHTWYNELIVSSKPIAPPQTPPAQP
jgi:hypothetical protein